METETKTEEEVAVSLTKNAADHVKTMQTDQPENGGKFLRVYVEAGGCSGFQYGMTFDEKREGDLHSDFYGVGLLVDAVSSEYLRGTVIDYVDSLNDGGFKISNPRARQSCGCGKSFEA